MKWWNPWRLAPGRSTDEARRARERAEQALAAAKNRRAEAEQQANLMHTHRVENHLAEKIRLAMGGKP